MQEYLEYWSGNPSNDVKLAKNFVCCPEIPIHMHFIEFC